MKLVKKGKKDKPWTGTCRKCFAEYEADKSELRVEHGTQREPGDFAHSTCPDPKCQGNVIFYPQD
jgi:hypothetical protein